MLNELRWLRAKIIFLKMCLARSINYVNLLNAGMLVFLLLTNLKDRGLIQWEIEKYLLVIVVGGLTLLILAGYIEIKYLKGFQIEQKLAVDYNPYLMEMKADIKKLIQKVEEIENRT